MSKSNRTIARAGDNGAVHAPTAPPVNPEEAALAAGSPPAPPPGEGPARAPDSLAEFALPEPPPAPVPDPEAELGAYLSDCRVEADAARPPRVAALQVRKPNDQEYVRVLPGGRVLPLFKDKTQGDKLYLFKPAVGDLLPANATRSYRLVLAKSLRALTPFIWPVPVPRDDTGRTWHESADKAARDAEARWVKVVADMAGGCYIAYPAGGQLPEPEWPDQPLGELILLAFKNQRIDGPGHPVIKRLNGEMG